jgi:hypothetical protein
VLRATLFVTSTLMVLAAGSLAAADEAKTPLSASMILSIVSAPVESRARAFDAGLKEPIARPVESTVGEVLPDGSVRYGRTIVTVRNPCPPGEHLDLPPLPGRRR